MDKLFEQTSIKSLTIPNRFIRSATWEGMANDDGSCTQQLINCMKQLASGGVGLIITGHTYVSPEGQAGPWQLGVDSDDHVGGLTNMTDAVHRAGGKIVMQLAHAGCLANQELSRQQALGPSVLSTDKGTLGREMSRLEINLVVEAFGKGAARAEKAGFDGVQIHAAHGYLLSQFLSPFFNKRNDEYGGDLENRLRIVLEVFQSIKSSVREDFPVMIKMNVQDFLEDGLGEDEALNLAEVLVKSGIDAIELSGGTFYSGKFIPVRVGKIDSQEKECFYLDQAAKFKQRITTPLMLVGGIRSFEVAERLVDNGIADYISLSRPLIREPDLINRWKSGDLRKATCISDNGCFLPARAGEGLYCVVEKASKKKL